MGVIQIWSFLIEYGLEVDKPLLLCNTLVGQPHMCNARHSVLDKSKPARNRYINIWLKGITITPKNFKLISDGRYGPSRNHKHHEIILYRMKHHAEFSLSVTR